MNIFACSMAKKSNIIKNEEKQEIFACSMAKKSNIIKNCLETCADEEEIA